jgi:hypothetical protein
MALSRVPFASTRLVLGVSATALLIGCFLSPLPDVRTPADRAREVEPKCKGANEGDITTLLLPGVVDSVEPLYAYVLGGPNGRAARLRGAKIHVRPVAGATREALVRSLECHQASVVLGRAATPEGDPYTLPDRWVSIDIESEGDGFAVLVGTDDVEDARRVLERARAFARSRPQT